MPAIFDVICWHCDCQIFALKPFTPDASCHVIARSHQTSISRNRSTVLPAPPPPTLYMHKIRYSSAWRLPKRSLCLSAPFGVTPQSNIQAIEHFSWKIYALCAPAGWHKQTHEGRLCIKVVEIIVSIERAAASAIDRLMGPSGHCILRQQRITARLAVKWKYIMCNTGSTVQIRRYVWTSKYLPYPGHVVLHSHSALCTHKCLISIKLMPNLCLHLISIWMCLIACVIDGLVVIIRSVMLCKVRATLFRGRAACISIVLTTWEQWNQSLAEAIIMRRQLKSIINCFFFYCKTNHIIASR